MGIIITAQKPPERGSIMELDPLVYVIPVAGIIGLLFAWALTRSILKKDTGTPEMKAIGDAIRVGAMAYLARQYKTISIISIILAVIIAVGINWQTGLAFLVGAFCSVLSGYIGMHVSVNSNIRTASAARRTLNEALQTSFRGGAVSGVAVVTLSLLGVAGVFFAFWTFNIFPPVNPNPTWLSGTDPGIQGALFAAVGYAFGASFSARWRYIHEGRGCGR
jgi:K(+)-stimulated pyrophosphate-energized sodium pump